MIPWVFSSVVARLTASRECPDERRDVRPAHRQRNKLPRGLLPLLLAHHRQEHRQAAGGIPTSHHDHAPLPLANDLCQLDQELIFEAGVLLQQLRQLMTRDAITGGRRNGFRGVDVALILLEAEEIVGEEKHRDAPGSARQIAIGLHGALANEKDGGCCRLLPVNYPAPRNRQAGGQGEQLLALARSDQFSRLTGARSHVARRPAGEGPCRTAAGVRGHGFRIRASTAPYLITLFTQICDG